MMNTADNKNEVKNKSRKEIAMELFEEGYNCAQSVFLAFEDMYEMDRKTALKLSSSFGAGMGRLREVCGSVSGMVLLCGMLSPSDNPSDKKARTENYALVQDVASGFKKMNGSIICRELLGLTEKTNESPEPSDRTSEYYKKRPCEELVGISARIIGEKILLRMQDKKSFIPL